MSYYDDIDLVDTILNKKIIRVMREEYYTRKISLILEDGTIIKIDAEIDEANQLPKVIIWKE